MSIVSSSSGSSSSSSRPSGNSILLVGLGPILNLTRYVSWDTKLRRSSIASRLRLPTLQTKLRRGVKAKGGVEHST